MHISLLLSHLLNSTPKQNYIAVSLLLFQLPYQNNWLDYSIPFSHKTLSIEVFFINIMGRGVLFIQ